MSPAFVFSMPSTVRPPSSRYPKWSAGTGGTATGAVTPVVSQVSGWVASPWTTIASRPLPAP